MKKRPSVGVVSLGCAKNLVDTEVMLASLASAGCEIVDDPAEAEALLVNTCAFIAEAVEEALEEIHTLALYKTKGRARRLVVAGCLVARYGDQILREIPEVDALVRHTELYRVAEAVMGEEMEEILPGAFAPRLPISPPHRAYLKIGEGCMNRCAYCLIPSLRGDFVSRPLDSLVAEARNLVEGGVKELTLVAQDTTRYGREWGIEGLPELIRSFLSIEGDWWMRVLYTHPSRVSDELLSVVASDPRVCRYLDIPFQHVSPRILAGMGRGDAPAPAAVIDRVRERLPGVFLRTTLMVGFPGETDQDFDGLLDFVGQSGLDHLGAFVYSREEGTPAAKLPGQVDHAVARARLDRLMALQAEVSAEGLAHWVGRDLTVMSEGKDEEGKPFGRHQGQAPEVDGVVYLDHEVPPGKIVRVRVTGSGVHDLEGKVV